MKSERFAAAALEIEGWLSQFANVRALSLSERAGYDPRSVESGWELDLTPDPQIDCAIRVLLTAWWPYARPLIAVPSKEFLAWPHVEQDGIVCALPLTATVDPYRPLEVTQFVLNEALQVVKEGRTGQNVEDFRQEFYSYWDRSISENGVPVLSILTKFESDRIISTWYGQQFILIADTESALCEWMDRRFGIPKEDRNCEPGVLLNLVAPFVPAEYPRHISDVYQIVKSRGPRATELLSKALRSDRNRGLIVFNAPTVHGRALAALRLRPPVVKGVAGSRGDVLQKGFRTGNVPKKLELDRYLTSAPPPQRQEVKRADANWIHGREKDPGALLLAQKRVAIIGIGSVGSFVSEMLAAAGVGNLTLVDDETLTFANAGRHLLGVDSEGSHKSEQVAALLQKRFPHHLITGLVINGHAFINAAISKNERYDLVLSLTSNWEFECFLNDQYLTGAALEKILFGWTEPHAVAGHAVLLGGKSGCLLCHMKELGSPEWTVGAWPETTLLSEPACGGLFQPYGPVEIMSVNAMIAALAVDALLENQTKNVHRIYAANESRILRTGGAWSEEWRAIRGALPAEIALTMEMDWPRRPDCPGCGGVHAV